MEVKPEASLNFEERLAELDKKFSGHIVVIPKGRFLFHASIDPEGLIKSGDFDPKRSANKGNFYFTDLPAPGMTNVQIELQEPIILFDLQTATFEERAGLLGNQGWDVGAASAGFDGMRGESRSMYVPTGALEISINPSGLKALKNNIRIYSP